MLKILPLLRFCFFKMVKKFLFKVLIFLNFYIYFGYWCFFTWKAAGVLGCLVGIRVRVGVGFRFRFRVTVGVRVKVQLLLVSFRVIR